MNQQSDSTSTELRIEGMHCSACVGRVESALRGVSGVRSAAVSLGGASAQVEGDGVDGGALVDAVRRAGYEAEVRGGDVSVLARREELESRHRARERSWRRRVVVGASVWIPAELLHWFGHWIGLHTHGPENVLFWVVVAGVCVVQGYVGWAFYRSAFSAARRGGTNMDTLIAIGSTSAFLLSWAGVILRFTGGPEIPLYFVESSGLLTLISLGHWLEAKTTASANAALRELLEMQPERAVRLRSEDDSQGEEVSISEVHAGDLVLIRAGDRVAVDGEIVRGRSSLDESIVTGESMPVDRSPGEEVVAGSVNTTGRLVVRATSDGANTTVARIAETVAKAQASKTEIQRLADRVSSIFVPSVVGIALLTLAGWLLATGGSGWFEAIVNATTVLVISCPCALGLATPLAVMVGSGIASKRGILVRTAQAMERAALVRTVLFDKTGTLTIGRPRVVEADDRALRIGAALASGSSHPLSRAVVVEAREQEMEVGHAADLDELPGEGVRGVVDGVETMLLSLRSARERGVDVGEVDDRGTLSVVVQGGRVVGVIRFEDEAREDAAKLIESLRDRGLRVGMVTGDGERAARVMAERVGLREDEVWWGLTPQGKMDVAREQAGPVAMVGDGINDAGVLSDVSSAGGVAIAMRSGSDVAMESADVVTPEDRLRAVGEVFEVGKQTRRTIKQNLGFAFGYNTLAIPAAAFGLLGVHGPIVAAGLMALSDLCVVGNSLRLRRVLRFRR